MPLGRDLTDFFPSLPRDACDYARSIRKQEITRREPHHHPEFEIAVIEQPVDLYEAMAGDMFARMVAAGEQSRPFVAVFPVGPVGQYAPLVQKINDAGMRMDHVHLFFMDEYAHEDGSTIDKHSAWSFENIAHDRFFSQIEETLRPPGGHVHFPGPDTIRHYDEMVMEASDGAGPEVIYGGIGWSGHFAFWDPHLWAEFGGEEPQWRLAHADHVRLHPMTLLHNSLRAGGDWTSIPTCAYTIGPNLFLSAGYRSFWCDASMGGGMSWQRFIGRLATHGPVTPQVPASYIQTLPGRVTFLGAVAEDIGGPRVSWQ